MVEMRFFRSLCKCQSGRWDVLSSSLLFPPSITSGLLQMSQAKGDPLHVTRPCLASSICIFSMSCLWHETHGRWQFWAQRKDLMMQTSGQGGGGQGTQGAACSEFHVKEEMPLCDSGEWDRPRGPCIIQDRHVSPFHSVSAQDFLMLPAYLAPVLSSLAPGFTDVCHPQVSVYLHLFQQNGTIWTIYPLTWYLRSCFRTFAHTMS